MLFAAKKTRTGLPGAGMRQKSARLSTVAALLLPFAMAACSVPDWADPTDWLDDSDRPQAEGGDTASPDYPKLSSVPDQPREFSSAEERQQASEGLVADRAQASYTDEVLTAGGVPAAAAPPEPAAADSLPAAPTPLPVAPQVPSSLVPATQATVAQAVTPQVVTPQVVTPQVVTPQVVTPQVAAAPAAPAQPSLIQSGAIAATAATSESAFARPVVPKQSELAAVIFFGHGSASLDERDREVLRGVQTLLAQQGGWLRIVGHASSRTGTTSATEHRLANFEVSLKRANAVVAELLQLGVDADQLINEAKADAQPVYHEFMPSGEAGNRRTEIFLEK